MNSRIEFIKSCSDPKALFWQFQKDFNQEKRKWTSDQHSIAKQFEKLKNISTIETIKYFTLSNTTLAGNDRVSSDDIQNILYDVKNKIKAKYEPKLLVWVGLPEDWGASNFLSVVWQSICISTMTNALERD